MEELLQELKKKIVEELDLKDVTPDELADDTLFSTEASVWIRLT